MQSIKYAVIAAAGLGSRLGMGLPKCLLKLEKRPLIEYQLRLLDDVENIRVVVGFQEEMVIDTVLMYRKDVIFVRNNHYRTTSTLTSYFMGAKGIRENCLFMDADIIFRPTSFLNFKKICEKNNGDNIIGITETKTKDAVFSDVYANKVIDFSREKSSKYEWANICYISPTLLLNKDCSVFEQLKKYLPLRACEIDSYEIDTPEDLNVANESYVARDIFYSAT